jgi:hypothetical protein
MVAKTRLLGILMPAFIVAFPNHVDRRASTALIMEFDCAVIPGTAFLESYQSSCC